MSSTNVTGWAGTSPIPGTEPVPDFMILPGWYMTAEWPSTMLGSTTVHCIVVKSSASVTAVPLTEPASSTLPSGRTNMNGYSGRLSGALGYGVQTLVCGLEISGVGTGQVSHRSEPETERTRPSGNVVSVGYQRGKFIGATGVHNRVTGS